MKKQIFTVLIALISLGTFAQVSINTDGTDPDASAILDVKSTDQGLLIPRMTAAQRMAITSPATGLMVYQTDGTAGFYYFKGSTWESLNNMDETDPEVGTNTTDYVPKWDGSSLNTSSIIDVNGQVGIGTSAPTTKLDVNGVITATGGNSTEWKQQLTRNGDTIFISDGNFIVIHGISSLAIPALSTLPVANISVNSASSGGTVISDGGSVVLVRGVCWSINPSPTTANFFSIDGSGLGSFSSYLTGLAPGTTYHVRAYATNSFETGYGNAISFTTIQSVQQRLNAGETPKQIYDSGKPLDSLYGRTYQGGLIAYLNTTSGAGFVAAPGDQSASAQWGCYGTTIGGANGTVIGTGAQNTIAIEAGCTTPGTAADICANLTLNTYSDWFLPSMSELYQLVVNLKTKGYGNFVNDDYWSSSQESGFNACCNAWKVYFGTGFNSTKFKDYTSRVRAIRAF